MYPKPIIVFCLLMLACISLAAAEDGIAQDAFARLRLAEVYFDSGADGDGYAQLTLVMAEYPGRKADFEARKIMVDRLLEKREGAIPSEADAARARDIVLDALQAEALSLERLAELAYHAGRALHGAGKIEEEVAVYQRALEVLDSGKPREEEVLAGLNALLWYSRAIAHGTAGDLEQSALAYVQAANRYPDVSCGAHAPLRLGSCYSETDPARAEAQFRAALAGRNRDVYWEAHYYIADFLVKLGRDAEALPYLDAFLEAQPHYSRPLFGAAQVLRAAIIAGSHYAKGDAK